MFNSKAKRILKYLETHKKGITQMDAVELFSAYRLSAIIFNLKRQGHNIVTEMEQKKSNGRVMRYARYVLVK